MSDRRRIWVLLAIYTFILHISIAQQKEKSDSSEHSIEIIKVDTSNRLFDAVRDNKVSQEILKSVTRKIQPEGF